MYFSRTRQIRRIHKKDIWLPLELAKRNMNRQKTICELLLQRLKNIVTDNENYIPYNNPK